MALSVQKKIYMLIIKKAVFDAHCCVMNSVSAMLYNIMMSTKSFIFIPDDNRL